jgi:hypothetical protein
MDLRANRMKVTFEPPVDPTEAKTNLRFFTVALRAGITVSLLAGTLEHFERLWVLSSVLVLVVGIVSLMILGMAFQSLADRKLLKLDDPLLAANHFVGLLLWIPVNKAMFTGNHDTAPDELERYAVEAVRAFLTGYGPPRVMPGG